MGVFDKIGGATYFEGGKYLMPGLHLIEVLKVKQGQTRQHRPYFVVECKIVESTNQKEHPIGTDASWMVMLDQDAAMGNIKHFVSVASQTPIDDVQAADAEDACSEANPLAGIRLRAIAVNIKTKKSGYKDDFTKVKFASPESMSAADALREQTEEAAKAAQHAAA